MKSPSTRIAGICAIVVGCTIASGALHASISKGGGKLEGYVALEGTRASALVPAGWSCSSGSNSSLGEENVSVLNCYLAVGSPSTISIRKMFDAKAPTSLESYLEQTLSQQPKGLPGDVLPLMPRMIRVGGRSAVEFAFKGKIYTRSVGGRGSQSDSVMHQIVFEHASTYGECGLTTSPQAYTVALRETLTQFCASTRFDDANPRSGKH